MTDDLPFEPGLGLRLPLMLAPMAGVSGGALAAAVSRAGGLGFIGGGYCDRDWIARELDAAAGATPGAAAGGATGARVGIGFIGWALAARPEVLDLALERGVRAVFLSFGDIGRFAGRVHRAGVPLFAQVQTVAAARAAVAAGAAVIVAQGSEAGGHGARRGTLALVPAVRDAIGATPLVAAGGIADGRGVAAALMLGADAVLCGTAFHAAHESLASPWAKRRAVAAGGDETVRSVIFDAARGLSWPPGWTLRALRNAFHDRWAEAPGAIGPAERAAYAAAAARGDTDTAAVIVGEAIDLVRAEEPAAGIVARLMRDAGQLLAAAPTRLTLADGDRT